MPRVRIRRTHWAALVLLLAFLPRHALAQPSASVRGQAADHYDRGVDLFERGQYAAAVAEFLAADELVPSSDALGSAIAAARRSNDHLLVLRAAEKGIARESVDPKLAAGAREALAEASRHLSRIEASCEPAPCALELDGKPIAAGTSYALPGTHTIVAKGEAGAPDEQRLAMAAGASYRVALRLKAAEAPQNAAATPTAPAPTPAKADRPTQAAEKRPRPLPPLAFYAGAGVTVVLIGVTTWSGLNTLAARDDLPERPTQTDIDGVESKITRTDVLLAATTLVGVATAYAGLALVDWEGGSARVGVAPTAGGLHAAFSGRF